MFRVAPLLALGIILMIGCAGSVSPTTRRLTSSLCALNADELSHSSASMLYDVLAELRPSMLRANLRNELPPVVLDGAFVPDAASLLHNLSAGLVFSVRRLSATAATSRYGLRSESAVLEIVTTPYAKSAHSEAGCV